MGEKLAIVSPKVQTTRHRIKGILTTDQYQVIFSDTPGIIDPQYKLHEKMMLSVKTALEDADLALLMVDINEDWKAADELFSALKLRVPSLLLINKVDNADKKKQAEAITFFEDKKYAREIVPIVAIGKNYVKKLVERIVAHLPEG